MTHPEAIEQERLIRWCRERAFILPLLQLLIHIPNGGKRDSREAARLKAQGVRAGVSDLFLPVARHGKHGLWIEMKVKPNKPTTSQKEWLGEMTAQGYGAVVCYSAEEAESVLMDYLTEWDSKWNEVER